MIRPKCIDVESVTSDAAHAALRVIEHRINIGSANGNSPCRDSLLETLHSAIQSVLKAHVDLLLRQAVSSDAIGEQDAKRDVWNNGLNI
jgi:hypothetical protein